jgi:hypothetical protein
MNVAPRNPSRLKRFAALAASIAALLPGPCAFAAPSYGDRRIPEAVRKQVGELLPQRPGEKDVYAVIIGGDGAEDVFEREALTVKKTLEHRLAGPGRTVTLINNKRMPEPEATLVSIQHVIRRVAEVMDKDEDLLFLHLTSHGAANHALVLSHPTQDLYWLGSKLLARILQESGIKHRVVVISACYSGGFIRELAGETTMVVTASSASQTSYGCGNLSEITDFSRAFYGPAMGRSRTLLEAAHAAVAVIHEDETRTKRKHSYPQVSVGIRMREYLEGLGLRSPSAHSSSTKQ